MRDLGAEHFDELVSLVLPVLVRPFGFAKVRGDAGPFAVVSQNPLTRMFHVGLTVLISTPGIFMIDHPIR